jgi:putative endonuclease
MDKYTGGYIYIVTNKKNGVLYIGVTSDLIKRIWEHKNGVVSGFTKKYNLHSLVYYEVFESIHEAIQREKRLKEWKREWKIDLIVKMNPEWSDLYNALVRLQ